MEEPRERECKKIVGVCTALAVKFFRKQGCLAKMGSLARRCFYKAKCQLGIFCKFDSWENFICQGSIAQI